jgi:two-component system nitrate/nitrite response regulator NarL
MHTIKIVLADAQPVVLEGLVAFLSGTGGVCVVGNGRNSEDVLRLFEREDPDIIVLDINLPGDCLNVMKTIAARSRFTKIIVFTASHDPLLAVKALDAGANAYVLKGSSSMEFMQAVECALHGDTYISPGFAAQVVAATRTEREAGPSSPEKKLSYREEQIVGLLLHGKQNREIAEALLLTERTVKGYMTGLMQKLNAKNRLEVVMIMQQRQQKVGAGRSAQATMFDVNR